MKNCAVNALFLMYLPLFSGLFVWPMSRRLLLMAFLSNVCFLPAQNAPHPSFRQYTTDEGLASPEAFCILQDSDGFIWISTDNGISRFDGYEFRNYGMNDGLLENVIFEMRLDTMGRLWMQAMSGNLYYMDGQTIYPYWNNGVLLNFKNRADTGRGFIVEGAGGKVHISTLEYGIITIANDGTITTYSHDEPIYKQVFEKNGVAIDASFVHGELSVQQAYIEKRSSQNRCYTVYIYAGEELWSFSDLFYSKKDVYTGEAFYLGDKKYLFQMFNDLWFIENGKVQWQRYYPEKILHTRLMENGQLYVGLYGHQGLRVYKSLAAFQKNEGSTWLPGASVNHFIEDREGGRWFATHEDGVFYAAANAFIVHDRETGLPDEKVTTVAIKNEKELYVGLENGDIWCLNQKMAPWRKLPTIPGKGFVRALFFDLQEQQLWAGRGELFYLQKNKWILCKAPNEGMPFFIANRIMESPGGKRLWLCNYRGFMSIELPQKSPANIHTGRDQRTYVVKEDFSGRVWIGQSKGLFEWKDGTLQERQSLHPAFSLRVEDIVLMPDSTLAVATKGGGIIFWKGKKFEQISTEQGLTADMLECLHADEKGAVWAGTLNGLNRISGTWGNRQVEQITVSHGLPSNEISSIRTYGEKVWVATSKGLVQFSAKIKSQFSPKPILASVFVNNEVIDLTKPLQFHSTENNLSINFFAINHKMNGKITYRYKMDRGDWVQTMSRSLNFPELPPGERFFEVQAQNEDGVWSESVRFQFAIRPPWWGTWWARGGASIAALSLVLIGYKYRTGQLKRENKIQRQIADLERSALQAQMNPHFIFNCLNSIQNYILQNEKESAIMYLGSFASLVRSMLNASVAGKILLDEEIKLLNNYLELEKLRFKNRFNFEVRAAESLDVFDVKIPPLLVQPYVENAVLHGISGRSSGGKVDVFFEAKETYLEVLIVDNGPGFKPDDGQAAATKPHKSFGMTITRNRLKLYSNKKEINTVRTKPLFDENDQIAGTKVIIQIGITGEFQ